MQLDKVNYGQHTLVSLSVFADAQPSSFFCGAMMGNIPYSKQALSVEDQILLLGKRGVHVEDGGFARQVPETVSCCRFSAYLYPFRKNDGTDDYIPGTSFNQ